MTHGNPARIEPGLEGFCERVLSKELTLAHVDPSWPAVFSTPAMIGMMEMATSGAITVGVRIEVNHLKAVPAGVTVVAVSKVVEIDGRRLIFEVEARSGADVIGRGRVFHTIVERSRFVAIAMGKHTSR